MPCLKLLYPKIYIPLWFYSNAFLIRLKTLTARFTFHYGSILICDINIIDGARGIFTFHYGSILIWNGVINIFPFINIYIPLWFYSNLFDSQVLQKCKQFTFHYGSILICTCFTKRFNIFIYIPLWFYSNQLDMFSFLPILQFTFHYGSILI